MIAALASLLLAGSARGQSVMGPARFTVISPELIRLEYQADGHFIDEPSVFAADRSVAFEGFREDRSSQKLVIDTGRIRLIYVPDGKPFSAGNLRALIKVGDDEAEWKPGMYSHQDLGGARNLDGTKGPAPMEQGLLSRDGWRLLDDSDRPLLTQGWVKLRPQDAGLDWYLFGYGHDYKAALKALTLIGGPVPMPRKYVLGAWYSRWWPHSAKDYQRIVGEYKDHDFPLDIVVLDTDWHKTQDWTGYSWNKDLFPDPEGFLKWVHEQGLFATLNDHIEGGIRPFEDHYAEFMRALGRDPDQKETLPFDAGDKKYMDASFKTVYEPLEKMGVDFWWLDYWDDGGKKPLNHLRWVNELYYRHSQQGGLRGQIFSRWGDWGNHRQPINFSGDSYILWSTLKFQVPFTANSGNAGAFFWAHDIGGYQGKRNAELMARWTQFGALSAVLRPHAMNEPWLDTRPWSYPKLIEDSLRASFHLRSELFPYIYSSVWQAHEDTVPLLRPMYLEYPEEERAYRYPQEYLYGDALLAAPIVSPGKGARYRAAQRVWLPAGVWYDWFSGARLQGPLEREFSADISSFPLFARGGVPIPMQPYSARMTTAPLKTLIVRVFPGEDGQAGTFTLYEDDGISLAYTRGDYCLTRLEYVKNGKEISVKITPGKGRFSGQVSSRGYVIELPGEKGLSAQADGRAVETAYDAKTAMSRIIVPERAVGDALELKIHVE